MSSNHPTTPSHDSPPRFTNRLAREKSPYLLQHAHNPVDWYPWGPEAFEKARREDKPVFLSVGYSACHWCHVMERESFESETVASLLNERFVSVKVDREERPDVDEVYMTAVQMMTRHGGWPMSVFLTPDGRPFYGGTYFPPESRHGRIGFASLITQLSDAWRNRRDEVEQVAATLTEDMERATRQSPIEAPSGTLDPNALLRGAVTHLEEAFDEENGGFGEVPKFPPHHALRLLIEAVRRGDTSAPHLLTTTLEKMALGGIYDHIGGGFHRYSTDVVWLLPHFEKMLYDNALLARVYADAYDLIGNAAFARIARETCDWVLRDMTDDAGGFHAALDADSEGEEGKYYVWSVSEVREALEEAAGSAFASCYNIVPGGNFRDEATGHPTGTNIPHLAVGNRRGVSLPAELDPETQAAREALLTRRYERVPPGKDNKVITAWNGLMIGALAFAGHTLNEPQYLEAALRAADFCLSTLRAPDGTLLRRYAGGEAAFPGYLEDHAYLADGLLDLHDATGEERWLNEARKLADTLLERFWDPAEHGFFFTGEGNETLIARSKDMFDGALPSPNGVAARVLTRLGKRDDGSPYRDKALTLLTTYHGLLSRAPQGTQTLLLAALDAFGEETGQVVAAPLHPVALAAEEDYLAVAPGSRLSVTFVVIVSQGFHINGPASPSTGVIPTVATLVSDLPAAVGPVAYPSPTPWRGGDDEELPVYQGEVRFVVPVALSEEAPPGRYRLALNVRCQPCSESECLRPEEQTVAVTIEVM